jgi:hypothetical protein
MPMVAMFIVFDFVIHNPLHAETKKNLSYLDIVAAHYARLDLLAQGTVHDAKVADFTSIARLYVESLTKDQTNAASDLTTIAGSSIRRRPPDNSLTNVQRSDILSQYEFEQLSDTGPDNVVCSSPYCYWFSVLASFVVSSPRLLSHPSHHDQWLEKDLTIFQMNHINEGDISDGLSFLDFPAPNSSLYMTLPQSGYDIADFFADPFTGSLVSNPEL